MKLYETQLRECKRDGTLILITCSLCQGTILVCTKYQCCCHAAACGKERMKVDETLYGVRREGAGGIT
jgi:hypothetical protein